MPGIGSYQIVIVLNARSWSSGYDRRLPSDGPGFNSRRTHFFLSYSLVHTHTLVHTLVHHSSPLVDSISPTLAHSRTLALSHSRNLVLCEEKKNMIRATGVEPVT